MSRRLIVFIAVLICGLSYAILSNGCSADENMVMKFLFKNSEKKIEIGRIEKEGSGSILMGFNLPKDHRFWPLYIKSQSVLSGTIDLSVLNLGNEDLIVNARDIDQNILKESRINSGQETLLYSGKAEAIVYELDKKSRLRPNEGGSYYTEWHPLISMSSSGGGKLKGGIRITYKDLEGLDDPVVLYTYLPPETL